GLMMLRSRRPVLILLCSCTFVQLVSVFFFQAEDGIRDLYVTGVQTCALPISRSMRKLLSCSGIFLCFSGSALAQQASGGAPGERSEERRVGKECRAGCAPA